MKLRLSLSMCDKPRSRQAYYFVARKNDRIVIHEIAYNMMCYYWCTVVQIKVTVLFYDDTGLFVEDIQIPLYYHNKQYSY